MSEYEREIWYDAEDPDHNPNICPNCGSKGKTCPRYCLDPDYEGND